MNGENKSKKATVELARSLSIQIDNLCQFLPQDKVVEFAAMTPVELLRSTQRAVGDQEMIDTHEFLKEKRRSQKEIQTHIDIDQETLANLESRQRLQEADVERMREREEVVKRVKYLESARPFAQYRAAKLAHNDSKEKMKITRKELDKLRDDLEPSLRAVKRKDAYKKACLAACQQRRTAVTKSQEHADKIDGKFKALVERSESVEEEARAEVKAYKTNKIEVARLDQFISRLKKQMEEPPPEVDGAAYNEKIVRIHLAFCVTRLTGSRDKGRD